MIKADFRKATWKSNMKKTSYNKPFSADRKKPRPLKNTFAQYGLDVSVL